MSRKVAYLLGILATLVIGIWLFINFCSECQPMAEHTNSRTTAVPDAGVLPKPTSFPFSLRDGDYAFEVNENFNFNSSSAGIKLPISENVDKGIESLKRYLGENPNKNITITGLYKSDETNSTAFPNLGLARANDVKNYLVSKGISSSQTETNGQLMDGLIPDESTFIGPINYLIGTTTDDADEKLEQLHDEIVANPLILYFDTGQATINLTAEQRLKVAKISRYLDKIDNARCLVIGHTDNTGSRTNNSTLGLERANFAKSYFVQNGIAEEKIETSSKGPDTPIATNDTEAGRSKNRRVEVTLN